MAVDKQLLDNLISLYDDELSENEVERKVRDMDASSLIELKNALDNGDYSKVDKMMSVSLDESMIKELSSVFRLSGLEPLVEYRRDLKAHELKEVERVSSENGLSRKYKTKLERLIGHDTDLSLSEIKSVLRKLGIDFKPSGKGYKVIGPKSNSTPVHLPHGSPDGRMDRGTMASIIEHLVKVGIYSPKEPITASEIKKQISNDVLPIIQVVSDMSEAYEYIANNKDDLIQQSRGEKIHAIPFGSTDNGKMVVAITSDTINTQDFVDKAKQMQIPLQESQHLFNSINEIAALAGLPIHETSSVGGTGAGAVASGPVGSNKPHPNSKKKKKKKSKNQYGYTNLIKRW